MVRNPRVLSLVVFVVLFGVPPTRGPSRGLPRPAVVIEVLPVEPVPGGFVQLGVRGMGSDSVVTLSGRLAGQSIPFERSTGGGWQGLAGVPVTTDDSIALMLAATFAGGLGVDTVVQILVRPANYPMERLRVAPRFTATPDSALAARVRREVRRVGEVSSEALSTPRLWSGPFARPRSTRVTSGYGGGREFNGEIQSRHLGVDLAGAEGEIVLAPNRGVVALVDEFYYGGNVVYLNHGGGVVTAYMHLSATLVAAGDTVTRGTPLGRVGSTGRVTGPHLHWIARFGSVTLDPLSLELLPLESFSAPAR